MIRIALAWLVLAAALATMGMAGGAATVAGETVAQTDRSEENATIVRVSRSETVVGAPVTLQVDADEIAPNWTIIDAPSASRATVHDQTAATTTIRPDVAGEYALAPAANADSVSFSVRNRSTIIERYAPILHFHEDGDYRPTRLEALVENARLLEAGAVVEQSPTVFDLAGRDADHHLELEPGGAEQEPSILQVGDRDLAHYLGLADEAPRYRSYQEAYPPTVYASVAPNVSYQGEHFTAITYWYLYTWDPKSGFAKFGTHQGDVESTVVLIDRDGRPAYVAPYAHGGTTIARFETVDATGTHPHLYVERGQHATYLMGTEAFEGEGAQVYAHWSDRSADCGTVVPYQSLFHSEHTGSADKLTVADYDIVELTGTEVWANYRGGLANAPGSITVPHQRPHYSDPGSDLERRACPVHEERSGWVELDDYTIEEESGTFSVTVGNDGGKPHEFWVTVRAASGTRLESEPVRVGAKSSTLFGDPAQSVDITADVDTSIEAVDIELWLHQPATRVAADRLDVIGPVSLEHDSWWFW